MNKIIVCIVLTVISIMVTIGSFIGNDISTYRGWMHDNHGQISEHFRKNDAPFFKDRKDQDRRPMRENDSRPDRNSPGPEMRDDTRGPKGQPENKDMPNEQSPAPNNDGTEKK